MRGLFCQLGAPHVSVCPRTGEAERPTLPGGLSLFVAPPAFDLRGFSGVNRAHFREKLFFSIGGTFLQRLLQAEVLLCLQLEAIKKNTHNRKGSTSKVARLLCKRVVTFLLPRPQGHVQCRDRWRDRWVPTSQGNAQVGSTFLFPVWGMGVA